jgi:5-formyltetrahydrofolate cyclo-ligase
VRCCDAATVTAAPTKEELRTRVAATRRAMTPRAREVAGVAISRAVLQTVDTLSAATVAAYLSIGTEPPTHDLVATLRSRGVRVLLPVLLDDLDLDWADYDGSAHRAQGSPGLWTATGARLGTDAVAGADVVVVPALAVDGRGTRLGRGGGSYDRALARVPQQRPVVALLYDGEVLPAVPAEAHDRPVTAAISPAGLRRFA